MVDKKNTIKQSGEGNVAIQNSEIFVTVSIYDEIEKLKRQGKYNEVADRIKYLLDFVGTMHPLYPHYRFKPVQFGETTVLEHEPLTPEAVQKYPLSYRGNFNIPSEQMKGYKDINKLIEDAFYKQEEVEINMLSLTTWLGNHPVETPNLDESLKEGKWVILPNPLPEPLKLKLYLKGESDVTIADYLEMSISGREANEFVFIDNSKQENSKLLISIKLPIKNETGKEYGQSSSAKINVKIKHEFQSNVEANRDLLQFLILATEGNHTLIFKNLQENKDFIVAPKFSFDGPMENLEKDYIFIERLYKIENHYNVTFNIPEKMDRDDWEVIEILEHGIENKPINKKLENMTVDITVKETVKNIIEIFEDDEVKKIMIERSGPEARLEFFDVKIPIEKVQTIYNSLKVDDINRLKKKFELMDEGETLRITLIPGEDNEYNEYYYFKI